MPKPEKQDPCPVRGLVIHSPADYLEKVRKKSTEISLLARGDGLEVMFQTIAPGSLVTVPAAPARDGFEFYYILDGILEADLGDGEPRVIKAGHFITVHRLEKDVYLKSETGVALLYVSSRPVFSELSEEINQLLALAKAIEETDPLLHNHCERLQRLALAVGEELRLSPAKLELLIYAAYLHDVGKTDLDRSVLAKTGPLTPEDWKVVHRHPAAA